MLGEGRQATARNLADTGFAVAGRLRNLGRGTAKAIAQPEDGTAAIGQTGQHDLEVGPQVRLLLHRLLAFGQQLENGGVDELEEPAAVPPPIDDAAVGQSPDQPSLWIANGPELGDQDEKSVLEDVFGVPVQGSYSG